MIEFENLKKITGDWYGSNRLWLDPEGPAASSDSTASVNVVAITIAVTINYTWSFDGSPQEGFLFFSHNTVDDHVEAIWIDSWHMNTQLMFCKGNTDDKGKLSVKGSYPAPPGPDWGWRITLDIIESTSFTVTMYNISPDNKESRATEVIYKRQR